MSEQGDPRRDGVAGLAGLYAQIAGVLAGFGFAGFTILLTAQTVPDNAPTIAATLFSAFATLILVAILYALLVGDPVPDRMNIGLCIFGLPFGLAVITMYEALTLLALSRLGFTEAAMIGRVLAVVVGPVILTARLTIAARYLGVVTKSGRRPHLMGWPLTLLAGALGVTALIVDVSDLVGPLASPLRSANVALVAAVLAGLLSPWVSTRPDRYEAGPKFVVGYLIVSFLLLVVFILSAAVTIGPG